ncbi:helix-turn-helix transcriptional regulator [Halorientalis brevis]|uniref:Helix-turn-helix transcriptional regulator n=1 Tax=Halorientalis brevis TaxID=1126241 RepID=A0ABD6C9B0_9EURY|nr:hypothetical protein [Halorientalis brevis]
MTRAGTVVLMLVLGMVSLGAVGVTVAAADASTHTHAVTPEAVTGTQTDVDPDRVLLRAAVQTDGTATWTIEYRVRLDDENATDAFESVAAEIRNDSSPYTERFTDRMQGTVSGAADATGREMALRNVSVETDRQNIGQPYGIIRYRFTWTGFAVTNETHIEAGDALAGFYLDGESQLRVDWPSEYRTVSVSPNATERLDNGVVWDGRRDFGSDGPRVVVTTEPAPSSGSGVSGTTLVGAAVVAVLLGAGGYLWARRRGLIGGQDRGRPAEAGTTAGTQSTEPASEQSADGQDDDPAEELLSNEERVLKLVEEEGGRIKQQQVAQRLDWTDAKTSQVVTKLRENDEIEVFRLGRENVLTHPDDDSI